MNTDSDSIYNLSLRVAALEAASCKCNKNSTPLPPLAGALVPLFLHEQAMQEKDNEITILKQQVAYLMRVSPDSTKMP